MAFLVLNNSEEKFAIPNGETVIGRGPYLRVKEPILSRSHAIISRIDSRLSIKPTHKNPTFFYSTNSEENHVVLEKDTWKDLVDGDQISLLPSSYKYRIEITCLDSSNGNKVKNGTCQISEEENENGEKRGSQKASSSCKKSTKETYLKEEEICMEMTLDETQAQEELLKEEEKPSPAKDTHKSSITGISSAKKRKLPSWMMETESVGKKKKTATPSPKKSTPKVVKVAGPKKAKVVGPKVTDPDGTPSKCEPLLHPPVEQNEQSPSTLEDTPTKKCSLRQDSHIETSPEHETCYEPRLSRPSEISPSDSVIINKASTSDVSQDEETVTKPLTDNLSDNEQPVKKSSVTETNQDEESNDSFSILDGEEENVECKNDAYVSSEKPGASDEPKPSVTEINQDEESNDSFSILDVEEENVECKNDADVSSEKPGASDEPKRCPYGKRCYRKNPAHFEEYSHDDNADNDNDSDNEQNSEDKRECPYGQKCYRQGNSHHTSKYTHTSIGKERRARQTRKLRKKKKSLLDKESDNEGENAYDSNDSFLASSTDSGGYSDDSDSDYKPSGRDYDDDEDEDIGELVSEAKGFIKNKKM